MFNLPSCCGPMFMSKDKLPRRDRRGPLEPSYKPRGLRWTYWSDLGHQERLEFLREREPSLEEVQEWLKERGFIAVPVEHTKPPAKGSD